MIQTILFADEKQVSKFGEQTFYIASLKVRNRLPETVRTSIIPNIYDSFRCNLQTHSNNILKWTFITTCMIQCRVGL